MAEIKDKSQKIKPRLSDKIKHIENLIEMKRYSSAYVESITLLKINEDKVNIEGLKPDVEIGTIFHLLAKVIICGEKEKGTEGWIEDLLRPFKLK